nr:YadA-like family protein [Inquilinus limosus]
MQDGVAVGHGATAGANVGDVALGSGSTTAAVVGTASTKIAGTTYTFAGATPTSTVSVGAVGAERTITNVAAGRIAVDSTDAVNGSQLFASNQAIETVANEVTNINNGKGIKYFHANSTEPDSQALGTDSVAIGPNAVANNAGDVALGFGSTTEAAVGTSGATIGGTAYTFAGANPTSTVSVGAAGAERTITNVAAGRLSDTSTDAVNGSQLFATNQQVTVNTGAITNLGDTINNIAGDTSKSYTDANGRGIRYVRTNDRTLPVTDSSAQGIGSTAVGYQATAVADSSLALGRDSQATVLGGVALGSGSVADRALSPATGQIGAGPAIIEYNTTDKTLLGAVSVGTDKSYRQITNVADGTDAQDAVTIRQLQGAIASVAVTSTKYFHANSTAGDSLAVGDQSVAVGPTTVVNGDNGVGIGNGAIVDQTAPGGTAIGQNAHVMLADGLAFGTNSLAAGIQAIAIGAGAQSTFANSIALGGNSRTTVGAQTNYTAFGLAGPQNSVGEVSIGAGGAERKLTNVAAGSADTDAVNVSQLKGTTQNITNLFGGTTVINPDGSITGPTYNIEGKGYTTVYNAFEAVNNSLTNINNGGGIKYFHANSTLADSQANGTNSVAVGPTAVASTQDSVAMGHGAQASANAGDVALGSGSKTQAVVGTSSASFNNFTLDGFAGTNPTSTVSVGDVGAERTITNVAAGRITKDSTDAINGSQLYSLASQVDSSIIGGAGIKYFHTNSTLADSVASGTNSTAIGPASTASASNAISMGNGSSASANNAIAIGAGAKATSANSLALGAGSTTMANLSDAAYAPVVGMKTAGVATGEVSFGSSGSERRLTNVAAGSAATDAVNVSQLSALANISVKYDTDSSGNLTNRITLGGGNPNAPVTIGNVAPGVNGTDAVNLDQLNGAFDSLNGKIKQARREAWQGAAIGIAASSLRYDDRPGKLSASVGGGMWHDQGALALGLGYTAESGWVRVNASAIQSDGDWGAGIGVSFTLN